MDSMLQVRQKLKQHFRNTRHSSSMLTSLIFSTFSSISGMALSSSAGWNRVTRIFLFTYLRPLLALTTWMLLQNRCSSFSLCGSCLLMEAIMASTVRSDFSRLLKKEKNWLIRFDSLFFFALSIYFSAFLCLFLGYFTSWVSVCSCPKDGQVGITNACWELRQAKSPIPMWAAVMAEGRNIFWASPKPGSGSELTLEQYSWGYSKLKPVWILAGRMQQKDMFLNIIQVRFSLPLNRNFYQAHQNQAQNSFGQFGCFQFELTVLACCRFVVAWVKIFKLLFLYIRIFILRLHTISKSYRVVFWQINSPKVREDYLLQYPSIFAMSQKKDFIPSSPPASMMKYFQSRSFR